MSQQNRRFAGHKPNASPSTNENIDITPQQPQPQPVQNSTNQSSTPTSTLPEAPPDFQPEELSIHISSDGRKKLVNSRGQESMIYPLANKFFGDYGRGAADRVGEHNRLSTINGLKKQYLDSFNVSPNSKIYNYNPLEIHLLSQFYQNLIGEGEKQQIVKEYTALKAENKRMKTIVLLFTAYVVATHRTKWSRLTANNRFRFHFYLIGGMLWAKSYIDLGAFQVNSIIGHNRTYENMLKTYENDYKIVY